MTIEQRLAEIIRAFHADALSSTVNLNVDLDIMLAVLAQALLAALRARLPGYHAATPDVIQRRFLETPGQIITTGDTITVRLERRAYTPVLRKARPARRHPRPLVGQPDPALRVRLTLRRTGCVEIRVRPSPEALPDKIAGQRLGNISPKVPERHSDTEEVTGSNPVRPTRHFLFLALQGSAL